MVFFGEYLFPGHSSCLVCCGWGWLSISSKIDISQDNKKEPHRRAVARSRDAAAKRGTEHHRALRALPRKHARTFSAAERWETDSPRGRIYLIEDMLEAQQPKRNTLCAILTAACRALAGVTTCSVRRELHASCRSCADLYRAEPIVTVAPTQAAYRWVRCCRVRGCLAWALLGARLVRPLGTLLPRGGVLEQRLQGGGGGGCQPGEAKRPAGASRAGGPACPCRAADRLCATGAVAKINQANDGLLTRMGIEVVGLRGAGQRSVTHPPWTAWFCRHGECTREHRGWSKLTGRWEIGCRGNQQMRPAAAPQSRTIGLCSAPSRNLGEKSRADRGPKIRRLLSRLNYEPTRPAPALKFPTTPPVAGA